MSQSDVAKANDLAYNRAAYTDRAMAAAEGRTCVDESTNNTSKNNNLNSEPVPANAKYSVCRSCNGNAPSSGNFQLL